MPKTSARPFSGLITNEGLIKPSGMDQRAVVTATSSRGAPRRATIQPVKKAIDHGEQHQSEPEAEKQTQCAFVRAGTLFRTPWFNPQWRSKQAHHQRDHLGETQSQDRQPKQRCIRPETHIPYDYEAGDETQHQSQQQRYRGKADRDATAGTIHRRVV